MSFDMKIQRIGNRLKTVFFPFSRSNSIVFYEDNLDIALLAFYAVRN